MPKYRFERTSFGWKAWKHDADAHAYIYIGHFRTQAEARQAA